MSDTWELESDHIQTSKGLVDTSQDLCRPGQMLTWAGLPWLCFELTDHSPVLVLGEPLCSPQPHDGRDTQALVQVFLGQLRPRREVSKPLTTQSASLYYTGTVSLPRVPWCSCGSQVLSPHFWSLSSPWGINSS
jgi:hypothetical protein